MNVCELPVKPNTVASADGAPAASASNDAPASKTSLMFSNSPLHSANQAKSRRQQAFCPRRRSSTTGAHHAGYGFLFIKRIKRHAVTARNTNCRAHGIFPLDLYRE